jgi:hypothetical protein
VARLSAPTPAAQRSRGLLRSGDSSAFGLGPGFSPAPPLLPGQEPHRDRVPFPRLLRPDSPPRSHSPPGRTDALGRPQSSGVFRESEMV